MTKENGKPQIRFAKFKDTWEQRKLGEMMEVTSVKRIHQSDWTDSGVRFLRARDIVAESKKENVSEPLFISQEKYDEYSAVSGKVKKGDLLVTGVGTIGVPMLINSEEPLYFKDGNIIWFKNENVIDGRFFYYSFNGLNIQKFIKESAGLGTVGTYTIENGKKTPINLPPKKDEQAKIGEYFFNLDHLITLHQRKYDKLTKAKKSMLEKMFPKNGTNVPEIRFKGFTDAWEQRKLSEVAEFNPKSELPETFEYVDLESVVGTEMVSHRTETRETAPSRAQRLARTGDVFFQTVRPYQRNNYLFEKPDNNYVFSTGYAQMRPKIDAEFLMCFLQTDSFVKVVLDNCTGTSYPAINSNDLSNLEIVLPASDDEQRRIGSFISNLDNLITLHQRKLEKLKILKKACLEKMFV